MPICQTWARTWTALMAPSIGFALDGEDLGVVDQAIDQGDDAGGVWKDLAPFGEGPVGGDDRAVVLVTAADELEQQVGMTIGIGEISDLVDHQKTGAGIVTQAPAQGGIAVECGELAEQLTGAGEQHGVTVDECLMGDVASER